jgi:curli biogenesis system outer membrane secretion channel CsgG
MAAILLVTPWPSTSQEVEYGSIAVVPFTSAIPSEAALQSARVLSGAVEEGLRESGRFMAVLERSEVVDSAVQAELDQAQSGDSFDSDIRLNTESQMNAKYLLSGRIERHEITQRPGGGTYDATVGLRVRIVDVETRTVIVNEDVEITNQHLDTKSDGGGLGGLLKRAASDAVGSSDMTPQDAINHVHENASARVQQLIVDYVSLLLVDYDVDESEQVSELIVLRAPDLSEGQEVTINFNRENRMGGGFRREEVGRGEITRMDAEYAYVEIKDGSDAVSKAIHEDPYRIRLLPSSD